MKLRHRLFLFSTGQLVVFGALFVVALWAFERSVIPTFRSLLRDKSEQVTRLASAQLDVALGADDRALMASILADTEQDPDFGSLVVRDARDTVVFSRGEAPGTAVFGAIPFTAHDRGNRIGTWAPVALEGLWLGSVAIVFDTDRLDTLDRWARRLAVVVALLWLCALAYSVAFARSFVSPIHAMKEFTREVADGALSKRLAIKPPGELLDLVDYLNRMTAELEHREHERKLAGQQVEDMQRELLAVSRMAGMAEIATNVLHNVGNVLNSLNVSVSMIDEQVRQSRVASLAKSIELFDGFAGGLPAFLATPKGQLLPGFLTTVSKRLVEDNSTLLRELASVSRNVEHIKAIVAMQQSYARPSGLSEPVVVADLIDDALRMGQASFAKHGIEVVREFEACEPLTTDRHKLLQILINLISNARHALKESHHPTPRLIVRVSPTTAGVAIEVADNGVGIPAENLAKIFQHGFTTKTGGHGFGLHASANAARELGGSLDVTSAGDGAGATFVLDLPHSPEETRAPH